MKNRLPRFSKKLLSLFLLKTILTGFLGVIIFEQEIDSENVMAEKSQEETFQEELNWTIDEKTATKRVNHFSFVIEDIDNPKIKARRESTFIAPVK